MSNPCEFTDGSSGPHDTPDDTPDDTARGDHYRAHREKILQLIRSLPNKPGQSLCVLGSGSCRDLDLKELLARFESVDLIDIDVAPTLSAIQGNGLSVDSRIRVIEAEITGVHELLIGYGSDRSIEKLNSICDRLKEKPSELHGRVHLADGALRDITIPSAHYDCVLSTCLLSQLMLHACTCAGFDETAMMSLMPLVRSSHLKFMAAMTTTGGSAILVTDVTSSEALPELSQPGADPVALYCNQVQSGNHFHGMHPKLIEETIKTSVILTSELKKHQFAKPWVWNADGRDYLCIAIRMLKRGTPER